jgi:hypothetical protein
MRNITAAMVIRGTPTPDGFYKGDIVRPARQRREGWRRMTHAESEGWYARLHADVAAGKDVPYDSAGESRLAPQDVWTALHEDRTYEVIRGRVNAPKGYGSQKGCCEVQDMLTGERFFCQRKDLVRA